MAIKPLVLVFQELRQPTANIVEPVLSGCVIGPHYLIKTYAEDKVEIFSELYDVAVGNTILALPAAVPGMKLKSDGFRLWFDRARVSLSTGTLGEITIDGILTGDTAEDFTLGGDVIKPGDTVRIEHDILIAGAATGDGDGANPERILMDTTTENIQIGDVVVTVVGAPSVSGAVITDVQPTYIVITPIIGTGVSFVAVDITIKRIRLIQNVATGQTFSIKNLIATDPLVKNKAQLTTNFPFAATGITYEISRRVTGAEILTGFTLDLGLNSVAIAAGVSTLVDALSRPLIEYDLDPLTSQEDAAQIYIEYCALDVTYTNIPAEITQNSEVGSLLGVTDKRNPLGLGALTMFSNAQATISAIGLVSEDTAGWATAVDAVNRGKFYAQALLTQSDAIAGIFLANNIANEAPEIADYGLGISSASLPETVTLADATTGEQLNDVGSGLDILFEDLAADFISVSQPVLPGDSLIIGVDTFIIDVIINANRLKIVASTPFAGLASGVTYTIIRNLTKTQQAESVAATSVALGNKRAIRTFPNLAEIDGEEVSGIFLTAVVAGLISGLPSQAGITNKGVAVVEKVKNTNWDYFNEDQLDIIATGGTLIMIQETPTSLPFVRHQLTTDPSLLETGEISVVKNADFIALYFKGIVKPYLGEWNVTEDLIIALRTGISQGIEFQKKNKTAKIGAPLIDATIESLAISDISPDRVEIFLETTQPKPLNTIGLHLIL